MTLLGSDGKQWEALPGSSEGPLTSASPTGIALKALPDGKQSEGARSRANAKATSENPDGKWREAVGSDAKAAPAAQNRSECFPEAVEDISYVLFGEPLPMPRPRVGRWGVKPPGAPILELKERHAEAATLARPSGWSLEGPLAVYIVCYRATRRRCDADNLAKLPLDALTGIAWEDDSQVVKLLVEKRRDELDPRTEVRVVRLER